MPFTQDMSYLTDDLSANIGETPEGFLVCYEVPIARIGTQKYTGQEIGENDYYDQEVTVHRLEEDVFDPAVLASFEGKPVTEDHPQGIGSVRPDNYAALLKGHVQNVKRKGEYIVADLIIMDPILIDKVKNRIKRQVSAGYDCRYEKYKGGFRQYAIQANHVAVVDRGRAGPKVSIRDSLPVKKGVIMNKKQLTARLVLALTKDGASQEEVEQAITLLTLDSAPPVDNKDTETFFEKVLKKFAKDNEVLPTEAGAEKVEEKLSMDERLKKIEDCLSELMKKGEDSEEHPDEEEDKKLIEEMLEEEEKRPSADEAEEKEDEEADKKDEKEEKAEDKATVHDAMKMIAQHLKPAIAKLPPRSQKLMKDAMAEALNRPVGSNRYAEIRKATDSHGSKQTEQKDHTAVGKDWAAKFNPHYKKN